MKKIINFRPILVLSVSLVLGALSAYLLCLKNYAIFGITLTITLGIIALFICCKKGRFNFKAIFMVIFALLFLVGFLRTYFTMENYNNADIGNKNLTVHAKVVESTSNDNGTALLLDEIRFEGVKVGKSKYKITLYVYGNNDFNAVDVGDYISFYGLIKDNGTHYEGRFSAENVYNNIKYNATVLPNEIKVVKNSKNVFEKVNVAIRNVLKEFMDEEEFGVAYALTCGNTDSMDNSLISNYRYLGVAHIFAVSGLHIGFMAGILTFLLKKCRCNRVVRALLTICTLIFYSGVCGFSSSSVRATVMASVFLLSSITGKKYDPLSALSLSALVVMLINPMQLFCVGFKLSFVVVAGLILLTNPVSKCLKFLPNKLAKSLSAVLVAQISGLVICINSFGYVSLISVLTNLILLPIVSVLFTALFLLLTLSIITGLGNIFLFLPNYAIKGLNEVVKFLDAKVFVVGGISIGALGILWYATGLVLSGRINLTRLAKAIVSAVLIGSFVVGVTTLTIVDKSRIKAYVLGSSTINSVLVTSPNANVLVVAKAEDNFSLSRLNRLKNNTGIDTIDQVALLNFGEEYDVQRFTTRILSTFKVKNVHLYKAFNETESIILDKSFPFIRFHFSPQDDKPIQTKDFSFYYDYKGKSVVVKIQYKILRVFGEFGEDRSKYIITKKETADLVLFSDYAEQIYPLISAKNALTFNYHYGFDNGEKNGTLIYSFN